MHIPKCGGTSVQEWLRKHHRLSNNPTYRTVGDPPAARAALVTQWLARPQNEQHVHVFAYEQALSRLGFIDGLCVYALIRDPAAWIISAAMHQSRWHNKSFAASLNGSGPLLSQPNYQTRWMSAGVQNRSLRLEVYRTERLASLLLRLATVLGLSGGNHSSDATKEAPRVNEAPSEQAAPGLSRAALERAVRYNYRLDRELHDCVGEGGLVATLDSHGQLAATHQRDHAACTQKLAAALRSGTAAPLYYR